MVKKSLVSRCCYLRCKY